MAEDTRSKFYDLLEGFDEAMLATRTPRGRIVARPMRIADRTAGRLTFVTSIETEKVDEIMHDPVVNISLQGAGRYVSISGRASVTRDQTRLDEVWNPLWKIWFPEGPSDPDLVLIEIVPDQAEYWDGGGLKRLRYLFEAGRALALGEEIRPDALEHGEVSHP